MMQQACSDNLSVCIQIVTIHPAACSLAAAFGSADSMHGIGFDACCRAYDAADLIFLFQVYQDYLVYCLALYLVQQDCV